MPTPSSLPHIHDPLKAQGPLISHRWIVGGIAVVIIGAVVAVYFALMLLFWQGQWQLIFHPSHTVAATPATRGIAYEEVPFDAGETGATRLTGWWIPADPQLPHQPAALLYLHEERGSLSDALPDLAALHALGYDIFAFDPQGYGHSHWEHPSEYRWIRDADAALYYLASVRHIGPRHLIVVGRGLGGTIAAKLTARNRGLASVVMIDPQPPTLHLLEAPRWTHILPVQWLASDAFNPSSALATTDVDKLFLVPPGTDSPAYVAKSAQPSTTVHAALESPEATAALRQFIERSAAMRAAGGSSTSPAMR